MMYQFWIIFFVLFFAVVMFDKRSCMLRDISKASGHQPYSWARVQLAWWSVIVLSAFIAILIGRTIAPTLHASTVILLGISAATTATARAIDIADIDKLKPRRHQDDFGKNFFEDILSDQNGVSIHRFQAIVFNLVFGAWFIYAVLNNLNSSDCHLYSTDSKIMAECLKNHVNYIMPPISDNNLILLGLSSATYAALKITENKAVEKKQEAENQSLGSQPGEVNDANDEPAVG